MQHSETKKWKLQGRVRDRGNGMYKSNKYNCTATKKKTQNERDKEKNWVRISKLMKDTDPQIQDAQEIPIRIKKNKCAPSLS